MKTFKKFLIFYIPALLLINFSFVLNNIEQRIVKIKDINLSDDTYIPVKTGQEFIIELEGNPTTGYSWFLLNPEKLNQENLLKATNLDKNNSGEFYSANSTENEEIRRMGAGGIFHFKFLAGEITGHEIITFIYKRPWTEEDKIHKSVNIKVVKLDDKKDL